MSEKPKHMERQVYTGNSFIVEMDGYTFNFTKVQGLKVTAEFIPVKEGGLNDRVHMLPAPVQQNGRVTFETGWCSGYVNLKAGSRIGAYISVLIMSNSGLPVGEFIINAPIVESWEISDLNAMESVVVVKRLTLIHSGIREAYNGSYL